MTKCLYNIAPSLASIFIFVLLISCASTRPVIVHSMTTKTNIELSRVDDKITQATKDQVDVLSPRNFSMAVEARDKAREANKKNKDQSEVTNNITAADNYLDKANKAADLSLQYLSEVIKERKNAISAEAPQYLSAEFMAIDRDLKKVSEAIESNDTTLAEQNHNSLETRYSAIELESLIKKYLGNAKNMLELATIEGAKNIAPQSLKWTEIRIVAAELSIANNRHNISEIERASKDANMASQRLLNMVLQAKGSSNQLSELLASQFNENEDATNYTNSAVVNDIHEKLLARARLENEFEAARKLFSKNEAEVYKQGDALIIRLKGLSFPKGQSTIVLENYHLLAKVQDVIKNSDPKNIVVEGHTDSFGPIDFNYKLSSQRATAIKTYLTANNRLIANKISAKGYAYTKPIASNKTELGRSQNRRVDVIITSKLAK